MYDYSKVNSIGEEIETLLSETKEAGNYEKIWNADGFSSCIYFYRLQAGGFVETKKLVLRK